MFKVMTWNVENLFRAGGAYGPKTQAAYDAKLQGLAARINEQAPDALSLQEIGEPAALDDLEGLLDRTWHRHVSTHHDHRGIRVAWLSPRHIADPEDFRDFPPHLEPVQSGDDGTTEGAMGRGAVAVTVHSDSGSDVRLVTAHLKSKLLTFPGNRFAPKDEDERARFAAYALYRRAAEARHPPGLGHRGPGRSRGGPGGGAHRGPQRHRPGRHHPVAPGPTGLGDRDPRVRPPGPGRSPAAVEPGPP